MYGGRELRRGIRQRGMGYVMAVRANHALTTGSGRTVTAAAAARMIPARAWHRMRTGSGTKGTRHYDWAMLELTSDDTPDGHGVLLARRHRYTGTVVLPVLDTPAGPAVPADRYRGHPLAHRDRAHRLHWSAWRRRHQHRARQAHQRWNVYAEATP